MLAGVPWPSGCHGGGWFEPGPVIGLSCNVGMDARWAGGRRSRGRDQRARRL